MHISSNPLAGKPLVPGIGPENLRSIGPAITKIHILGQFLQWLVRLTSNFQEVFFVLEASQRGGYWKCARYTLTLLV